MTEQSFRGFRCWNTPTVQKTIFGDIASLGLDADAVFLAAHTSLDIEHIKGARVREADRELTVLRAVDSSFGRADENTIIAITGPSGSGKSHLVRWVRAHMSDEAKHYRLIYVPRELATLRELIGHVLEGMPGPDSDAVKAELDKAVTQKGPEQMAEELLDRLRSVVSYELPDSKGTMDPATRVYVLGRHDPGAAGKGRKGGLADLLLVKPIRDHLLQTGGAIAEIVKSLRGKRAGRDQGTPEFTTDALPTKKGGVVGQLGDADLRKLWTFLRTSPQVAADLLNEALPRAVEETLGMRPGVNLGEVFRKTRMRLRGENTDLVLLFEDLAQFGLFDGELYNQFVLQPGSDYAPIRALFAITDGKFDENVPPTVQTRLTHHFRVSRIADTSTGEGGVDKSNEFVARYLNVARVGRERLIKAWNEADAEARESGTWIPNACWDRGDGHECPHREECWPAFGSVHNIGLYPYNETALRRGLQKIGEDLTPRALVDEVTHDFLIEADAEVATNSFPSEEVRKRFDFQIRLPKDTVVPPGQLDDRERDRLHRSRVIWADGAIEHPGITKAFSLPSLTGTDSVEEEEQAPVKEDKERPRPLVPLFSWENGDRLPEKEAVYYRERLYELVLDRVDLAALLIDMGEGPARLLVTRVLAPNSFELANAPGQPAGKNRLRFPIQADGEGVLLLAATRWFWDHGHWETEKEDRSWDFQGNALEAQLILDEFLDSCARSVEDAITAVMQSGPLDPAAAAISLRAIALRCLGRSELDVETLDTLEWVVRDGANIAAPFTGSSEWADVGNASLGVVRGIDPSWVAAFATARQDAGEPLVIDAARLIPIANQAASDPLSVLARPGDFDDSFSELAQHWHPLRLALETAVQNESEALASVVENLEALLAGNDLRDLALALESAGRLAADNGVFRPQNLFGSFRDACDRLTQTGTDEVLRWLGARSELTNPEASMGAVLDAQRWADTARQLLADLQLTAECLLKTKQEIEDRLIEEVGQSPDALTNAIATKLGKASDVIAGISEKSSP